MPTIRAQRGSAFTPAERADILARFRRGWERREAFELLRAGDPAREAAAAEAEAAAVEMAAAAGEYVAGVPIVALARSPFTAEVFETSLDLYGLDGLWWAYDHEYRPYVDPGPTFFAWTGALKLDAPIPEWSLKAMVGPEAPFVLPRILEHPALRAVVTSILIGEHVGFPIVYFASEDPGGLERVDDWGHRSYTYRREDGSPASAHSVQDDEEKDFELGPWIDRGKLLWILPGDTTLTLRAGRAGCPFLDLPGERRRRYIQEGETWLA